MGSRPQKISVEETRELWDQKAAFWDMRRAEGNAFHEVLIDPAMLRLLNIRRGQSLLDIGTGNGAFACLMADAGAQVVACDFSSAFIERAQERGARYAGRIDYQVLDATDEVQLLSLGERRFDAAGANMVLMDMVDIEPLARSLARLLKPNGCFVFAVQHPCFNSNVIQIVAETKEDEGRFEVIHAIKVRAYLDVPAARGLGILGEPVTHYYFHRPLHQLFGVFFAAGFMLDGMEEPTLEPSGRPLVWSGVGGQIPPVLVVRLRLMK